MRCYDDQFEALLAEIIVEIAPEMAKTQPQDIADVACYALRQIAELGANPITEHGCTTRKACYEHIDKMWQLAFQANRQIEELQKSP